ncbi:aldo/keto reductase [Antarcticibacterium sp. 1MA-6-2]|uniref:aldo/keto reductase n=1 Tax=Antarcticibacterium sp. 1MA-6-2 TaxID=2908210 RepID=UPI0021040460|nr:aldo/keto reductase [Antarcticibacterium sp. 1MA-6-2]
MERLDLIQLHCPPTDVYYLPEIFETFDRLQQQGKIDKFGVSVEKVEEALKAIEYDIVDTVQIIFNLFRQRPSELFFQQAREKNIGIIARVPLASGLLTGKFDTNASFDKEDHRNFNRNGEAFDKGETFSGLDFDHGLRAVEELKKLFPEVQNLAPIALQWILKYPEVSCTIPGASKEEQLLSNLSIYDLPELSNKKVQEMNEIYVNFLKEEVHQKW